MLLVLRMSRGNSAEGSAGRSAEEGLGAEGGASVLPSRDQPRSRPRLGAQGSALRNPPGSAEAAQKERGPALTPPTPGSTEAPAEPGLRSPRASAESHSGQHSALCPGQRAAPPWQEGGGLSSSVPSQRRVNPGAAVYSGPASSCLGCLQCVPRSHTSHRTRPA